MALIIGCFDAARIGLGDRGQTAPFIRDQLNEAHSTLLMTRIMMGGTNFENAKDMRFRSNSLPINMVLVCLIVTSIFVRQKEARGRIQDYLVDKVIGLEEDKYSLLEQEGKGAKGLVKVEEGGEAGVTKEEDQEKVGR